MALLLEADNSKFMEQSPPSPTSHLFGRRKGRPLRVRKTRLMEELLPKLLISLPENQTVDPAAFFSASPQALWVEVGFGGGEHLAAQAQRNPHAGLIGCEPFLNGVASLLDHLDRDATTNVRIYNNDARHLLDALPDASVDQCFVLFADPWPKTRHSERRFIGPENLTRLARVLKKNGRLRLASDHPVLVEWMRDVLKDHPDFACAYNSTEAPVDWVCTRYQEKAIAAGRVPVFMDYHRA